MPIMIMPILVFFIFLLVHWQHRSFVQQIHGFTEG
jgi:hypothetical protein